MGIELPTREQEREAAREKKVEMTTETVKDLIENRENETIRSKTPYVKYQPGKDVKNRTARFTLPKNG